MRVWVREVREREGRRTQITYLTGQLTLLLHSQSRYGVLQKAITCLSCVGRGHSKQSE